MKFIPLKISHAVGRNNLKLQAASPKIMFGLGIVGSLTSTVLACRATLKLEKKLDTFKSEIEAVPAGDNRQMTKVYVKNTAGLVRLYGPALIIGGASFGALTTSHVTLTRRNTALGAAYTAVAASYESYRERVREQLGINGELDAYHAVGPVETLEKDKKVIQRVADPNKWSPYARFFDEACASWDKNPELNRLFVQCQQNYLNHLLQSRGHVFLNEAYDALGIPRSSAGQVVGWVMGNGDSYIDFGMFEVANSEFINGYERSILLDFNVDGVVHNLI